MAPTKYNKRTPSANLVVYVDGEFRNVQLSLNSIIEVLKNMDVQIPIEVGPADSAGVGFRTLRIPN